MYVSDPHPPIPPSPFPDMWLTSLYHQCTSGSSCGGSWCQRKLQLPQILTSKDWPKGTAIKWITATSHFIVQYYSLSIYMIFFCFTYSNMLCVPGSHWYLPKFSLSMHVITWWQVICDPPAPYSSCWYFWKGCSVLVNILPRHYPLHLPPMPSYAGLSSVGAR